MGFEWGTTIQIGVQLASVLTAISILWGVMSTRVTYLERLVEELKAEVKDFRKLSEDLAVVKTEIHSIKDMISKLIKEDK